MKNVSQKKNQNQGAVQVHLDPTLITWIKDNNDEKSDKYSAKIKLCRDPTPETLDLYDFKISLLGKGKLEEFLLFIQNFKMTLDASGMLVAGANIQYRRALVCGEALHQLDTLSVEVGSITSEH